MLLAVFFSRRSSMLLLRDPQGVHFSRRIRRSVVRRALAVIWLAAGCTGLCAGLQERVLDFAFLAHGSLTSHGDPKPSLRVIGRETQRAALLPHLRYQDHVALRAVDLSKRGIVVVFDRVRPSSGYSISITRVTAVDAVLEVTVALSAPNASDSVRLGFETPYQAIEIARDKMQAARCTRYRLRDIAGAVLRTAPLVN